MLIAVHPNACWGKNCHCQPLLFSLFFSVLFWNTLDRGMSDATLYGCCLCCILVHFFIFSQVDKEEVRLRRTIGLKKDEYFLDGKHITWVLNVVGEAPFSLIPHGCVYQHLALAVEWCSLNCVTWFSGKPKLWIYWKVLGSLAQILTMLCSKERYLVTFLRNWIALFSFHFALRFMQHTCLFSVIMCFPPWLYPDCFIDSIVDIDEGLWTTGFTKGNWWHSSLWGETPRKFENYARNR